MDECSYELEGTVESVVYHNRENGYCVLRLETPDGTATAVGTIPMAVPGERLLLQGRWITHAAYGEQFKAEYAERSTPKGRSAIFAYLSSGAIRGLGEKTARRIVDKFGDDALNIIEHEPEKLTSIKGITHEKAMQFNEEFRRQAGLRRLTELLSAFGLSPFISMKLYSGYGNSAVDVLKNDPYILTSPEFGAPFHSVDEFALSLGIPRDDPRRAAGALLFELRHNTTNGHVFLPYNKLAGAACELLDSSSDVVGPALDSLIERGQIIFEDVAGEHACYLPPLYFAESTAAAKLKKMAVSRPDNPANIDSLIEKVRTGMEIDFAEGQMDAILLAAGSQIMLLTGGPGTGKTTTVKGIIRLYESMGLKVALAAPTGRAAKRMSELSSSSAATLHRLLQAQSGAADQTIFIRDAYNPLRFDAVILDETSMVDIELMSALLNALTPDCRLVMIGDPDQLPSVGPGRLLSDLIRSGTIPTVRLTEVFRQAQDSGIVSAAHGICRGEAPSKRSGSDLFFLSRPNPEEAARTVVELCAERLPAKMGIPANQIQTITPTRKGPCGSVRLNALLREALNPPSRDKAELRFGESVFRRGDRVMQIRNNYDLTWIGDTAGTGVFNGDIGTIISVDTYAGIVTVDFDDHIVDYTPDDLSDLEPAWAITVHKAQGSEFRAVVFAVCAVPRPLEIRSLFYTGVTRAQELLIIAGDENAVARMCSNDRQRNRYSGLRARLAGA
ncbi:MAG: ATP-dependent RecD-like DNA helicase [Clostridiales bacterium]|jgi:exodeoxyribonuclease V alpha subunit|nr:ATP-dependent RecD-like DNA helicase [Clostridiales bacterium]